MPLASLPKGLILLPSLLVYASPVRICPFCPFRAPWVEEKEEEKEGEERLNHRYMLSPYLGVPIQVSRYT